MIDYEKYVDLLILIEGCFEQSLSFYLLHAFVDVCGARSFVNTLCRSDDRHGTDATGTETKI